MDVNQSSQGLDQIFRKLGHDLVEIRCRALTSIVSKLEHNLLQEADLVQERQLFIRLLEWFNFSPSPMQDEVLKLLVTLSKHTATCELLVTLGAVKFLTDLRPDLESALKPQLDILLDRLFHVTDGVLSDQSRCTYQRTSGSLVEDAKLNEQHEYSTQPFQLASGYFHSAQIEPEKSQPANQDLEVQGTDKLSYSLFPGFPWHFLTTTDRHVLSSTSSSLCSTNSHLVQNACSFLLDVVFRDFPAEIFLQRPTILNTLLTLLSSRPNSNLMIATSECLSFISQSLLVRIFYYQDPAMYCPRQGLPMHQAAVPGTYQNAYIPSVGGRPNADGGRQERRGGDGRDENSSTSLSSFASSIQDSLNQSTMPFKTEESLEDDQTATLQLAQVTTEDFCLSSLKTVIPLLRIDSATLFLKVYQVAINCVHLLNHILDAGAVWSSQSPSAQALHSGINSMLEGLGEAVLYHYHLNSTERVFPRSPRGGVYNASNSSEWSQKYESRYDSVYHRIAYHACAVLATSLLKAVLPMEESANRIKSTLSTALYVIACDEALSVSLPEICTIAEAHLEQCNEEKHGNLIRLRHVVKSIFHTHQFLEECKSEDRNIESLMELASSSFDSLPYYSIKVLIPSIVQMISEANSEKLASYQLSNAKAGKEILLRLLSHSITRIRSATYNSCMEVLESFINIEVAAEDTSGLKSHYCNFLLDGEVLYEICLHGISDSSVLVSAPAQDLILHLLKDKLLMDEELWERFRIELRPVMPVLQAFMGETELLRGAIFGLLSNVSNECSSLEKTQSLIRALMIKQRSVRSIAAGMMLQVLTSYRREVIESIDEEENCLSLLLDKATNIVGLTDLLIIESPMSLMCCDPSSRPTGVGLFHEDAVVRMLGIFRSRSIDVHVRRSALQQLSVMLSDPKLHTIFLKSDGLSDIKTHVINLVKENNVLTESEKNEGDSCVVILRCMAQWHSDLRLKLYQEPEVILCLLRMIDLCRLSTLSHSQATATLALLLFTDILEEHKSDDEVQTKDLSLPAGVLSRYQVPFLCPSHHVVSIHRVLATPPSQCDPLTSGPAAFAIQIASALAKCDNDVVKALNEQKVSKISESSDKKDVQKGLKQSETIALSFSYPDSAILEMVSTLSNASSHSSVRHAILLLRILLSSSPGMLSPSLYKGNEWHFALDKFLQVLPSSVEDEALLLEIVHLLSDIFRSYSTLNVTMRELNCQFDESMLSCVLWLVKTCISEDSSNIADKPLFHILKSSEPQREPFPQASDVHTLSSVAVRRQLCKAILSMLSHVCRRLPFVENRDLVHRFQALLCQVLLIRLKLADAPQFYDLPSMEVTLECLLHVTASRPGWINSKVLEWQGGHRSSSVPADGTILCRQLTSTLLEVVSAFHIESRGSSMSYMGKGVSRSATQSIVHLTHEIVGNANSENQIQQCLALLQHFATGMERNINSRHIKPGEGGYDWMLPLWSARDPRIRYCGVALATVISRTLNGCILLANSFQEYLEGLWSMSFGVLFDDSECSAVREQAASLLTNLVSHEFQAGSDIDLASEYCWQGPVVKDEESGTTLTGLSALLALLTHLRIYQHLEMMISCYSSSPSVQPATILYTPFMSTASYSTSTQNSFLTGRDSTPITQQTMYTVDHSQTASTTQDATPNVSASTSGDEKPSIPAVPAPQEIRLQTDCNSVKSIASSFPSEWQALCTPALIANVCRFLKNLIVLAPHETINLLEPYGTVQRLARLVNPSELTALFLKLKQQNGQESSSQNDNCISSLQSTILSLISQYAETSSLLQAYSSHDKNVGYLIFGDEDILERILKLLNIVSPFDSWNAMVHTMQINAMDFISTTVNGNLIRVEEHIKQNLSKDWQTFSESMLRLVSEDNNQTLLTSTLIMLSNLFNSMAMGSKKNKEITSFNNLFSHDSSENDAAAICTRLIDIFESVITRYENQNGYKLLSVSCNAIQSIFAISPAAKEVAVSLGFIEQLLAEVKRLQARLELFTTNALASFSRNKSKSKNSMCQPKECEDIVSTLILLLHVLNNLLHKSPKIKELACEAGLGKVITKMWSWTTIFPKLLITVLKVSLSFSSNCNSACSSLACSPVGQQPMAWHIISYAKELSSQVVIAVSTQSALLQATFSLLSNLSISPECRSVMWKSNLLGEFLPSADRGQHPKRTKQQSLLLTCWLRLLHCLSFHSDGQLNILKVIRLRLLHCLSFHSDGQLNILKVSDILEVLVEIQNNNKLHSEMVMNILRNLCFHNPSKHRISSNAAVVRQLMSKLSYDAEEKTKPCAAYAVWALLSNSQKSKVHLKGAGVTKLVQNTLSHLTQKAVPDNLSDYSNSLRAVLELIET